MSTLLFSLVLLLLSPFLSLLNAVLCFSFQQEEMSSTKDHVEGNLHQAKGSVKETVGHAFGNNKM